MKYLGKAVRQAIASNLCLLLEEERARPVALRREAKINQLQAQIDLLLAD